MTQKTDRYTISLSDCLEDIAENFIYAESETQRDSVASPASQDDGASAPCHVPSFVLVPFMFEARKAKLCQSSKTTICATRCNDLIDEFSTNPEKYISDRLRQKIDEAVSEYLAAPTYQAGEPSESFGLASQPPVLSS